MKNEFKLIGIEHKKPKSAQEVVEYICDYSPYIDDDLGTLRRQTQNASAFLGELVTLLMEKGLIKEAEFIDLIGHNAVPWRKR